MASKKKDLFENIEDKLKKIEGDSEKLYEFEEHLENTKGLDQKKKVLWKQIYRNAVQDRAYALSLYTELYQTMTNTSSDHMALGSTLTKYLEKASKSNQQLLDLSILISKDESDNSKYDPDSIFNKIEDSDD